MKPKGRRIYLVRIFDATGIEEESLVRATHPARAAAFAFNRRIECSAATPDDVERVMSDGGLVEDADPPAATDDAQVVDAEYRPDPEPTPELKDEIEAMDSTLELAGQP